MEASIIKIGNSHGLIIPKRLLNQLGAKQKM
jgi:antitoxin component of MazEF toxin-antitoxin module